MSQYVAYNNAFRMLFMLPRDCSAIGMFAVHNVMSCPALVSKLVFSFYKIVKASQNSIVQAIPWVCASDIWWKSSIRANWNKLLYVHNASHTSCHLYVAFAFFYYAVTYNYVTWTEGVSEIN